MVGAAQEDVASQEGGGQVKIMMFLPRKSGLKYLGFRVDVFLVGVSKQI